MGSLPDTYPAGQMPSPEPFVRHAGADVSTIPRRALDLLCEQAVRYQDSNPKKSAAAVEAYNGLQRRKLDHEAIENPDVESAAYCLSKGILEPIKKGLEQRRVTRHQSAKGSFFLETKTYVQALFQLVRDYKAAEFVRAHFPNLIPLLEEIAREPCPEFKFYRQKAVLELLTNLAYYSRKLCKEIVRRDALIPLFVAASQERFAFDPVLLTLTLRLVKTSSSLLHKKHNGEMLERMPALRNLLVAAPLLVRVISESPYFLHIFDAVEILHIWSWIPPLWADVRELPGLHLSAHLLALGLKVVYTRNQACSLAQRSGPRPLADALPEYSIFSYPAYLERTRHWRALLSREELAAAEARLQELASLEVETGKVKHGRGLAVKEAAVTEGERKECYSMEFAGPEIVGPLRKCAREECEAREKLPKQFQRCARCQLATYCSRECQKAAWPQHKTLCKKQDSGQ